MFISEYFRISLPSLFPSLTFNMFNSKSSWSLSSLNWTFFPLFLNYLRMFFPFKSSSSFSISVDWFLSLDIYSSSCLIWWELLTSISTFSLRIYSFILWSLWFSFSLKNYFWLFSISDLVRCSTFFSSSWLKFLRVSISDYN